MSSEENSADDSRRALTSLHAELCAQAPSLQSKVESEIKNLGLHHHVLEFRSGERSSVIDIHAAHLIHAAFLWDDRPLFENQFDDREALAAVINRWVCEIAMPSRMREEFSWLEIDELADYYESGEPVVGEFMRSWDAVEEYYSEETSDYYRPVRQLIRVLREAGYDRKLRAGQSMASFGLSRAVGHGLRDGQLRVWFDIGATEMDVDANFGSGNLQRHPVELTEEVRSLLDALAERELD